MTDALITNETIKAYQEARSAWAITSGTMYDRVPDNSHFFRALNDALITNQYEYLPVSRLFEITRNEIYAIQNRANYFGVKVEPQFSKINYLKDYGGEFVFFMPGGRPRALSTDIAITKGGNDDSTVSTHISNDFKVAKSIHKETINLNAGDRVEVSASGVIMVGQFLGNVIPRGRVKGLLGLSIDQYNIVPKYPHGALMYRLDSNKTWQLCGDGCEIRAPKTGNMTIEFRVNDNNTSDNSGSFDVTLRRPRI